MKIVAHSEEQEQTGTFNKRITNENPTITEY